SFMHAPRDPPGRQLRGGGGRSLPRRPAACTRLRWYLRGRPSAAFVRSKRGRLPCMIVVGFLGAAGRAGDLSLEVARRAAATGARVEMVGVAAPDADGDARLLELAAAGVGHATVVRSGADSLDAADLDLALHYLPEIRAIVLVGPDASLIAPAAAESSWSGAGLVLVSSKGAAPDTSAVQT